MKYIDAEKLKAEIERLKKDWEAIAEDESEDLTAESMIAEYEHLLLFLDALEDATYFEEQPSEDLEKEAVSWAGSSAIDAFEAGAQWQKEQFEKNRLTACDNQTKEDYDRETAFVEEILKEHRQPTFSDAINYGMRLQREQMLKDAVEGEVHHVGTVHYINVDKKQLNACLRRYPEGANIKIIIVKED